MRVLAMDLSLNGPGMVILDVEEDKVRIVTYCYINNKKAKTIGEKLYPIAVEIRELIEKFKPDVIVREKGFTRFAGTTQKLFKVVGVSDLTAYECGYYDEIVEYPPTTVKKELALHGKADKAEVEQGVRPFLVEDQKEYKFTTDDVSDACAVGITHLLKAGIKLKR